jgi:hypothetical protein
MQIAFLLKFILLAGLAQLLTAKMNKSLINLVGA